jgi:hypothetical protein
MKKNLLLVCVAVCFLFAGCSKKEGVVPLDKSKIDEAVQFGKDNVALTETEFIEPWTLSSGGYVKGGGVVTVVTPFLRIALLSKKHSNAGSKLNDKMFKELLMKEAEILNFEVTLYGDEYSFARNIDYILVCNDKEYKPIAQFMPSYSDMGRDYTCIAKGWVKFDKKDIPDDSIVNLKVKFKTNLKNKDFENLSFNFNLKDYK